MAARSRGRRREEAEEKKDRIFNTLLYSSEPQTIYSISKKTGISTSTISLFLDKLVGEGVALKTSDGRYVLQPVFYMEPFWRDFEDYIMPIMSLIKDYCIGDPDLLSILYYLAKIIYEVKQKKR